VSGSVRLTPEAAVAPVRTAFSAGADTPQADATPQSARIIVESNTQPQGGSVKRSLAMVFPCHSESRRAGKESQPNIQYLSSTYFVCKVGAVIKYQI